MKYYSAYMNRQQLSPQTHQALLHLGEQGAVSKRRGGQLWLRSAALAACCALVVGMWQLGLSTRPAPPQGSGMPPAAVDQSQEGTGEQAPPDLPQLTYPDAHTQADYSIALPEGSFTRALDGDQIARIFAPAGQERAALPRMLGWEGYTLSGQATYDGRGRLLWLFVWGEDEAAGASFTLELAPDQLPPTCTVDSGLETGDVSGTPVATWSRSYDRDGDGNTDAVCFSQFMAGAVGVRFQNANSPFAGERMEGARQLNRRLVRQALAQDGGLSLEALRQVQDVPAWRVREFSGLDQARTEAAFAPYLPQNAPEGYGEFYGRLSYQQDVENMLWVRWSRGYDDVEVQVRLPQGEGTWETVELSNPASYDTRLYTIPWYESVPRQYLDSVDDPVFRAQDMSLAVVQAREVPKDTGGYSYRFRVLHQDGTLVGYNCAGLSAQQVWDMVEGTL